ncbi:MAG: hypothetical protein GVY16_11295 [Planctomycetes bacterium]|jgi:hypothetical protein|nr:hypothetical protein [Planctomycetota bacterium]
MARSNASITPPAFSKDWWLGGLRNLVWIALVTVLIWVYADMEFTDTASISSVTLTLNTQGNPKVMLLSDRELSVSFEVAGSQTGIENFRQQLEEAGSNILYDVSRDYGPGTMDVQTRELLTQALDLKGITIESAEPQTVRIELDALKTIPNVPVDLAYTGAKLKGDPLPALVTIRAPESRWQQAGVAEPRLSTQVKDLSRLPADTHTVQAEVNPFIGDLRVLPKPTTVSYEIDIVSALASETIPKPVSVLTPAAWSDPEDTTWDDYVLIKDEASDWRGVNLTIVGPRKDLTPDNVTAFIRLTDEDKKPVDSWLERQVQVYFAPGTDLQLQGPAPSVRFRMQQRQPSPGGAVTPR